MSRSRPHVVVVGCGVTGAFAAYWLGRLGARVTIVESAGKGKPSVSNPGGLNPLHGPGIPGPMEQFALASHQLHRDVWPSLSSLSGIDFRGRAEPRIALALDARDEQAVRGAAEPYARTPGFSARWLDRREVTELERRLSDELAGGMCTDGDLTVDAKRYVRAVSLAAIRLGAELVGARARGLRTAGDRVLAVELDSEPLVCDAVVIATGAWVGDPERWLGLQIPVEPVKGELLLVRLRSAIGVSWRGAAIYPRDAGSAWLGGTEQRMGFDHRPSEAGRDEIRSRVAKIWPKIDRAPVVRHVAGLRPATPDELPIVGMAPGWANVCLALGAGRKGMLLSAGIGRAAAELVTLGATQLGIGPCEPQRLVVPLAGAAR